MGRMSGGGSQKEYRLSSFWDVISNFGDKSKVRGEIYMKGLGFLVG